jgi:hypothetical protein
VEPVPDPLLFFSGKKELYQNIDLIAGNSFSLRMFAQYDEANTRLLTP